MNKIIFFALISILCISCKNTQNEMQTETWLTDPAANILFAKQPQNNINEKNATSTITIDDKQTFQTMDGYGFSLTGGSAFHIHNMDAANRAALLKELFATDGNNIGISYLRVSIGASDLDDHVFSYDDLPKGQTDTAMEKFSIAEDKKWLIPVLKEILAINPHIKILGSPWSAPLWMKTNDSARGGSLKPEYHNAYAKYFVKYIQAMKAEGVTIDAITIQNEPLHPGNTPSMYMLPEQQLTFIKNNLGPAFKAASISTKIILYDHNADRPDYPMTILADKEAAQYVDGSAFHLYAGPIDTLSKVHDAFPGKNLYFTEQWTGAPGNIPEDLKWNVKTLLIGGARNWCKNYLQWNLAANSKYEPHTSNGGCDQCLGGVTIDGNQVKRNSGYYNIAHGSKFVRPGSVRIASNMVDGLPNVAFKTPDGKKVLVVLNESNTAKTFKIADGDKAFTTSLNSGAVATYVW